MRLRQPDKQLKAQSKGRQLVGVPRQGCLPHPAARDPASMAKVVHQVWLCFLSFIYGPIPDRQVPSSKFNQGDAVHSYFTHGNKSENNKTSLSVWEGGQEL